MILFERIRMRAGALALGSLYLLSSAGAALAAPKTPVELTIFHTNDLHSRLHAVSGQPLELGGSARMATLLKRLRGDRSMTPSLTLDAGDWSEGSWLFSVDAGSNVLRLMDLMGYDAVALGDHDYLTGPDQVTRTIRQAGVSFPVLAANLNWPIPLDPTRHPMKDVVLPYAIKELAGVQVGIIGLTHSTFMFEDYLKPVEGDSAIKIAARTVAKLRKKVDVLIVLSHNEHLKNTIIAKWIPGIDLVVSGHSHEKTPEPRWVKNVVNRRTVPVIEGGQWGQFLGELKLQYDPAKKKVSYRGYRLHPVTSNIPEDPEVKAFVRAEDEKLGARFGDIHGTVADATFPIRNDDGMRGGLATLAARSYRNAAHAELSLEEVGLTGADLPEGPLSLLNLHDVLPHLYNPETGKEWTVRVWNARGRDLKVIFQVYFSTFGLLPEGMRPGWIASDNVSFFWKPGATKSVRKLLVEGKPVDSKRRYKVALTEGLLFSFGIANRKLALDLDLSDTSDTGIEAWRAIANYAEAEGKLTPETLCLGCDYQIAASDIAVPYFYLEDRGGQIGARVVNFGGEASRPGKLQCDFGIPDGFAEFETDVQRWSPIGEALIPALKPGESIELAVPWQQTVQARKFIPVRCRANVPKDGYSQNDSGMKVFRRD